MKILYKYASRSRPENFFRGVDNIYINSRIKDFQILATLDEDDLSMNNDEVRRRLKNYDKVYPVWGKSNNKIHAINRGMGHASEFDILINMSDDMMFIVDGFDVEIDKDFNNDLDLFLHYNDGNQRSVISTMSIMGKDYYNRFNYI